MGGVKASGRDAVRAGFGNVSGVGERGIRRGGEEEKQGKRGEGEGGEEKPGWGEKGIVKEDSGKVER